MLLLDLLTLNLANWGSAFIEVLVGKENMKADKYEVYNFHQKKYFYNMIKVLVPITSSRK
jgi:hypothetical protein